MSERILTNAQVVTANEVFDGTVVVRDGMIADVAAGRARQPGAEDLDGDLLIPGLVELHTDALEGHMMPRPGADWPATAAVYAHDNQLAASGITTVLDALALGALTDTSMRVKRLNDMIDSVCSARESGLLRTDHLLHLRCEISYADLPQVFDNISTHGMVHLVSLMDHTPGQRQFTTEAQYRKYYQGKFKLSDAEMDDFIVARRNDQVRYAAKHRRHVVDMCRTRGITLASHDDATAEHVAEAVQDGIVIAEFPTTTEAARLCYENGIGVMMGAPNIVRGGSHSGNVSARELAANGHLDIVSSDYVPTSLLLSAMILADKIDGIDLPAAIRTVSKTPAERIGLNDRGEIAVGKRADLARVHCTPCHPVVREVWREGKRVA